MERRVEFRSVNETVVGTFITPPHGQGPFATVVMGGGWCYVKEIVMPHYAKKMLEAGLAVLMFDYRCLGESGGEPRQHLDPWAQIEDFKNAISFATTQPDVDPNRIGAWGISYGGGHVLIVGASDPRVRCIVSNIPVVDGYDTMRREHGGRRFDLLMKAIMEDRLNRFRTGQPGRIPFSAADPDTTLCTCPFPTVYEVFKQIKETEAPRHENYSTVESVEMLLSYTVFPYVRRILNTPTLMIVAENDNITLWDREIDAFNDIPATTKKLEVLPDVSHMSLYSKMSHLELASVAGAEFMKQHLAA